MTRFKTGDILREYAEALVLKQACAVFFCLK